MKRLITIPLALAALLATGCAALDVAGERIGQRADSLVDSYCSLPKTTRAIVRWEGNEAVKERGVVVVGCVGEPEYDQLRQAFVEPLSDATFQALLNRLLTEGSITLPDGTRLRIVAEGAE